MRKIGKIFGITSLTLAIAVSFVGCHNNPDPIINPSLSTSSDTGTRASTGSEWDGNGNPAELPGNVDVTNVNWDSNNSLEKVYFDYNSYVLRSDAVAALQRNAQALKLEPGRLIQVEGHCDERGTQEYNLALGEKRALAVRGHLVNLGISPDRILTISYGEEVPAVTGSGESVWSQNRRCEFNLAM